MKSRGNKKSAEFSSERSFPAWAGGEIWRRKSFSLHLSPSRRPMESYSVLLGCAWIHAPSITPNPSKKKERETTNVFFQLSHRLELFVQFRYSWMLACAPYWNVGLVHSNKPQNHNKEIWTLSLSQRPEFNTGCGWMMDNWLVYIRLRLDPVQSTKELSCCLHNSGGAEQAKHSVKSKT